MRPDHLLREMLLGHQFRTIAFVGSGLSYPKFPTWQKFLTSLLGELSGGTLREVDLLNLDLDTLLMLVDDYLENARNRFRLNSFMERFFKVSARKEPPSIFDSLVRSPFAFYITTNYDTHIEDAFRIYRGQELPVVLSDKPSRALQYAAGSKCFVFKIHGCARLGGPYVIGRKDYLDIIHGNPEVRFVLQSIFAMHPILFMGYGLRDSHINRYFELERQALKGNSLPRVTFKLHPPSKNNKNKNHLPQFDAAKSHDLYYGISTYKVSKWDELKDILDQFSFLQIRGHYAQVRKERLPFLKEFLEEGKRGNAWDALLCSTAASELGYTNESQKIREVILSNQALFKYISETPHLHLIYRIIAGQMAKRLGQWVDAKSELDLAERIAQKNPQLTRSLRALALRYAGILRLSSYFKNRRRARLKAKTLFEVALQILGKDFPEESLDQRKWLALLQGETGDYAGAIRALEGLVEEADEMEYLENAAWCRYNIVDQAQRGSIFLQTERLELLLNDAIIRFEGLDHYQGLSYSHRLLGSVLLTAGENKERVRKHGELALAYSVITGDSHSSEKCRILLASITIAPS